MKDENLWACLIGMTPMSLYRMYLDQMVTQRYLAAKTVKDAVK